MSISDTPRTESATDATSEDHQKRLFLRNLVISLCLAGLGLFVTVTAVVTILVATNFNVLGWME